MKDKAVLDSKPRKAVYKHSIKPRQRKLAQLMVENMRTGKEKHLGVLVKQAGYTDAMATKPVVVTRSQGFLAALDELGLTDDLVVSSLVEDIRLKPQRRAFELSIAAKIRGLDRRADEGSSGAIQIANALIMIAPPSNGSVKPLKDRRRKM